MQANATNSQLADLLHHAVSTHGVPGASVAVLKDGEIQVAAAGVANTRTAEPLTPEHLFSFGSVTKVLTATAVVRLASEGRVELDASIRRYLSEFNPPDHRADQVTVRHLLTHTCGIVGTIFEDTGRGPDALAKQVALINQHPLYHRPGACISYSNSGLVLLGRLLEVTAGKPWSQAFAECLTGPLGLETVVTDAEQAVRWRHVVGHQPAPNGGWNVEPMPFAFYGHSPAGSTPMGRPRDLVTLAQCHLEGGRAADGAQYLNPTLTLQMQELQAPSSMPFLIRGFGLGWMVFDFAGRRILGHDGATMGSTAFLRVDPERKFAVALTVNATLGLPVYETVVGELFRSYLGVFEQAPPVVAVDEAAVGRYLGTYADITLQLALEWRDGRLILAMAPKSAVAFNMKPHTMEVGVVGPGQFMVTGPDAAFFLGGPPPKVTLSRPMAVFEADGTQYLQMMVASHRRT